MLDFDDDEIELIGLEAEKSFWYISEHWDEYCRFCIDHKPEDFPIPENYTPNISNLKQESE